MDNTTVKAINGFVSTTVLRVSDDVDSSFTFSIYLYLGLIKAVQDDVKNIRFFIDATLRYRNGRKINQATETKANALFIQNVVTLKEIYNEVWTHDFVTGMSWLSTWIELCNREFKENPFGTAMQFINTINENLEISNEGSVIILHLIRRTLSDIIQD